MVIEKEIYFGCKLFDVFVGGEKEVLVFINVEIEIF